MKKSVRIITLGCRMNQAEDAVVAGDFVRHGWAVSYDSDNADVVILRSCAVTRQAERSTLQSLRAVKRVCGQDHLPIVVVTGCAVVAVMAESLYDAGVDIIVPKEKESEIVSLVEDFIRQGKIPRTVLKGSTGEFPKSENVLSENTLCVPNHKLDDDYLKIKPVFRYEKATLKVQDGCDLRCTYCIVPFTRGPSRSYSIEALTYAAEDIFSRGYNEIVLTGCNLACFDDKGRGLDKLIDALMPLADVYDAVISLGSIEPGICDDVIIAAMLKHKNLKRFIHLPIQSGDSGVLRIAARRYNGETIRKILERYRDTVPGLFLSGDFIAGLPGEDEAALERTAALIRDFAFDQVHIFPYSKRQGTAALAFKAPSRTVAKKRAALLREAAKQPRAECTI